MTRRVPIFATIIVVAAAATMVGLGIWQLGRKAEKEALIASYQAAAQQPLLNAFPENPKDHLFRRTELSCDSVSDWQAISGRSERGQTGFAHVASCNANGVFRFDAPGWAEIAIGWSRSPDHPQWEGGKVTGTIAPGGVNGWRLVADPPLADLQPMAKPDPGDLPNNHLAYAGQWFFFALTALVIYVLALRRRAR